MKRFRSLVVSAALGLAASSAGADTIVGLNGKPSVATSWSSRGNTVTLAIKKGFAAADVAAAIQRGIPGAVARAKGDAVVVSGVDEAALLQALERIEVDPELDSIDGALAALQGTTQGEEESSGSSIRASKASTLQAGETRFFNVQGTVLRVMHKSFPLVALSVRVTVVEDPESGLKVGETITVLPRIRAKSGRPDLGHPQSKRNMMAWYARPDDDVTVRIGRDATGKYYVADDFERRRID